MRAHAGGQPGGTVGVRLDAGRAQLRDGTDGVVRQPRLLPDRGRQREGRRLGRVELQRRQLEVGASDPVADLVGEERRVAARLDRDAEAAKLLLVALERPLEGGVRQAVIALDGLADVRTLQEAAGHEQADRQIHDAL